uniref:Uncharacterized protein n=1 Tax=Plectus sambesii TaxID=2011161 RepID=A0A914VCC5_9BILA
IFNFRDDSTLLDLFKGLTEEFCAYQRKKMLKYPLLADQVRELSKDRIAQAIEYRVYEEEETAGRVFIVASLESRFQAKNLVSVMVSDLTNVYTRI